MSVSNSTDICNMALSHLKFAQEISNLATDTSAQATACRVFYDTVRSAVLRDYKWPFATTIAALGLLTTNPFPDQSGNSDWSFAYQYPANAANLIRIVPSIRLASRQARIPFSVYSSPQAVPGGASNSAGKQILCNVENAMLEYVTDVQTEDLFTPDFVLAFSLRLAAYIAPRATSGDPYKLGARAMDLYKIEIETAKANSINEEQMEHDRESESIRARGGGSYGFGGRDNYGDYW